MLPFTVGAATKRMMRESSPKQIKKALRAVRGEQGASLWAGHKKAERFHFRLKQQRAHDRRRK